MMKVKPESNKRTQSSDGQGDPKAQHEKDPRAELGLKSPSQDQEPEGNDESMARQQSPSHPHQNPDHSNPIYPNQTEPNKPDQDRQSEGKSENPDQVNPDQQKPRQPGRGQPQR